MAQIHVLGIVRDLMFVAKIGDTAKRAGCSCVFLTDYQRALAKAEEHPALVIIDLGEATARPIEFIAALKNSEKTRNIPVIGFFPHVQVDLKRKAEEAGCDRLIPRSAQSRNT